MRILGIETSCDETSASVVDYTDGRFSVLSNVVASQIDIHAKTGGVVPEVAARNHVLDILPAVEKALRIGNSKLKTQNSKPVDLIAVTTGPGLIAALLVGIETARYLAYAWEKPIVGVNHLAGHMYSALLPMQRNPKSKVLNPKQAQNPKSKIQNAGLGFRVSDLEFPAIALLVSGGHTELVLMKNLGEYTMLGATRDDAAGEAFDKTAKMLGLPYPGGPNLAMMAEKGDSTAFDMPRGMIHSKDFDFSFSGLKTSVLYRIKEAKNHKITKAQLPDFCASVQAAIVDVLVAKTVRAAEQYNVKTVLLGGGVSANKKLRSQLHVSLRVATPNLKLLTPHLSYCMDNAAMIAAAGAIQYGLRGASDINRLYPNPHLTLT